MKDLTQETSLLYNTIREDINPFSDALSKKLISTEAGPGSGKTTFLLDTIKAVFGEYITNNKQQIYHNSDGNITAIPAGSGNESLESEETVNKKTNNKQDIFYPNADLRVAFLAFNTSITKEIQKKTDKIEMSVGNKKSFIGKSIIVKTSHGLLFKLAENLGLFKNGMSTDYTKGSFTRTDMLEVILDIEPYIKKQQKEKNLQNFIEEISEIILRKESSYVLSDIMKEIYNCYYETPILFKNKNSIDEIIRTAEKLSKNKKEQKEEHSSEDVGKQEKTFEQQITALFSIDSILELIGEENYKSKEDPATQKIFATTFVNIFLRIAKKMIEDGKINIGHDFYYKNAYVECMNNPKNLLKLFSAENNPDKYFNILFIDEAQDLTPIMIELIAQYFLYAREHSIQVSIAIVGDSKQAIYGFSNRENAFRALENKLGCEKIMTIFKNKSFRVPQNICNFLNSSSKELYSESGKDLESVDKSKEGFVYPYEVSQSIFTIGMILKKQTALVVGRSNVEITLAYTETMLKLLKYSPELTKYMKIDSKVKSSFKKVMKDGIDALDDEALKEKVKFIAKNEKVYLKDIMNNEAIYNIVPSYIKKLGELLKEHSQEEIEKVFNQKSSSKAIVKYMTAHAAKGLESHSVYLLDGIHHGLYGGQKESNYNEELFTKLPSTKNNSNFLREIKNLATETEATNDNAEELISKTNARNNETNNQSNSFPKEEEANIFYVAASRVVAGGLYLSKKLLSSMINHIDNNSVDCSLEIMESKELFERIESSENTAVEEITLTDEIFQGQRSFKM